jgi:hypothetical protein
VEKSTCIPHTVGRCFAIRSLSGHGLTANPDNHPRLQHSPSRHSIAPSNGELAQSEADYAADTESITTAETVVRWSTPPQTQTQNRSRKNSQSEATARPLQIIPNNISHAIADPADMRLDEERIRSRETRASQRPILEKLDSGPPTPDTDDTPYIRYAIDVLTRDDDLKRSRRPPTADSEDYPVERHIYDQGLGYVQSVKKVKEQPALVNIGSKPRK